MSATTQGESPAPAQVEGCIGFEIMAAYGGRGPLILGSCHNCMRLTFEARVCTVRPAMVDGKCTNQIPKG